jgi:hypothetical protein
LTALSISRNGLSRGPQLLSRVHGFMGAKETRVRLLSEEMQKTICHEHELFWGVVALG